MNPLAYQEFKSNKKLSDFGIYDPMSRRTYGDKKQNTKGGNMKVKVEESKKLKDGQHEGKIEDVKYRTEPYAYTDIVIKMSDGFELTAGYPTKITEDSALGNLLKRFGANLKLGSQMEVEEFINKGREVEFMTLCKKSVRDGKEYSNIIPDSVKPK